MTITSYSKSTAYLCQKNKNYVSYMLVHNRSMQNPTFLCVWKHNLCQI